MRTRAEPPFWSTQPVIDSVLDRMQIRLLCAPRSTGSAEIRALLPADGDRSAERSG